MNTVELRDPEGSYVLALPVDDVRCRVLDSNIVEKNKVLFKDHQVSWEEAGEDLGGFTRLGPSDLEPFDPTDRRDRSLLEDLEAADACSARTSEVGLGPVERIPDPASLRTLQDDEASPRELLEGLLLHYATVHAGRCGSDSAGRACHCPGFRSGRTQAEARLHALVALATEARKLPDLKRLVGNFQKVSRKGARAA